MLIGLTTSYDDETKAERLAIAPLREVRRAGGVPVLLPPVNSEAECDVMLSRLDGLVITGGGDISNALYGDYGDLRKIPNEKDLWYQRDMWEAALIRGAHERDLPTLGICRGMQLMNVSLGGALYQDILTDVAGAHDHRQDKPYSIACHRVYIEYGSCLAQIVGDVNEAGYRVNSMHHQAVSVPAFALGVCAVSDDGLIEAIEDTEKNFFLGVQWHPEYLADGNLLFVALCDAARRKNKRNSRIF
ncbi:MAG: gamma-glutamyl-gamma-aminobutyrate hydrolase family protein [Coriobacteriales bacterium]|jgi:putative glutamine amidotransferase|nr:gamma-glutamyl-gamma-aminobutyrate hydrolase family protein [Coriobacteriales bacterium]